ncbi:MAG: NfeD family protein [Pseudomonadota bacterium]
MIVQFITDIGPWFWFVIGLMLLLGEVAVPGVYMIWFGLSAVIIGTLTLTGFADVKWWPWQVQMVAFAALSLVLVFAGRTVMRRDGKTDAAEGLNAPLKRFVGVEVDLDQAIASGVGRVRLADTTWRVKGPDLPAGTKVRVTGLQDDVLVVEKV